MNKSNLMAWWSLDESSGNRADSHGTNTLTDNNTVGSASGKQGNAADFESANSESLSITDNASLSTGDIDFCFGGWVNLESKPGSNMVIAAKGGGTTREWVLLWNSGADRFRFFISSDGSSASKIVDANVLGSPSTATWYFIVAWHDAGSDTINIQINNGTVDSLVTAAVAPADRAGNFALGIETGDTAYLDGLMDEAFFFKRVLTSDERTQLYNSGNGLNYSQLSESESDFFLFFF